MNIRWDFLLTLAVLTFYLLGCDRPVDPTADDAEREVSQADNVTQQPELQRTQRETFLTDLHQELIGVDAQMEVFDERAGRLNEDARQEWEDHKGLLAERMRQINEKVTELERTSDNSWESIKEDVERSLAAFRSELREVIERLPEVAEPEQSTMKIE